MIRLLIAGAACIGLILFFTLIVVRLIRSRRRGLSVRMQVFLALAGIIGAFAFGLGILVIDRVEARAERLALAAAHDEAHAIAALLASEMKRTGVSFSVLSGALDEQTSPRHRQSFALDQVDALGVELLSTSGTPLSSDLTKSRAEEPGAVFIDAEVRVDSKLHGYVRVVKPTIVVEAMLADFAPTVLVISLVLGAAAALAAAYIGRTIAAPIEALSTYSEMVSAGERPRLPLRVAGREVGRLVRSIDTMRRRLEGRPFVETFAADLSHELKNPVAAIRASAEVLAEGALEEPEQARRFVGRIHEAAQRIETLLAQLLSLAEVETRGPAHLDRVLLSPLLDEVLATFKSEAERIRVEVSGEPEAKGDRLWLSRGLSNLIDNALTHSPKGSPVRLLLTVRAEEVVFMTENEGFLEPHLEKSLFSRFVTTRREEGGTGLGLSIVRAIAEAHGGEIEVSQATPDRVTFELRLPAV